MVKHSVVLWWQSAAALSALVLVAGCGEAMQFENAGSKHALVEDQQACDQELQTLAWAHYVNEAKGRLDPWQVCIERKGWKRVENLPINGGKL